MRKINKLYEVFKNLKFREDFIIIHSDILSFYKLSFTLDSFFEILIKSLGKDKTLIFPTFNLKKRKKWYLKKTISESGSLSEFVRKYKKNVRSLNPLHSIIIY